MPRPPAQQQGDTLARVQTVAFALFGRYGYEGVSMVAVARGAGITKAALYWYFSGKEALYADCMQQVSALFREHVFTRMAAEPDPVERLLAVFEGMGSLLSDPRVQEGVAGYWLAPASAEVTQARLVQRRFEQASADAIADALREAVAADRLTLGVSPEETAQVFITTMEAIVLPLRRANPAHSRRLIGILAHIFFRATAHGPELAERALHAAGPQFAAA